MSYKERILNSKSLRAHWHLWIGEESKLSSIFLHLIRRCRCDGIENGFVKLIVERGCLKILGCTIVAPNAGDMITEVTVCMQHDLSVAQLAGVIHPYPTTQEAVRQCALQCYKYFKDPNGSPMKTLQLYMNQLHHSSYQESGKSPGLETIETP